MKEKAHRIDYLLAFRGFAVLGVILSHAFLMGEHSLGGYISASPGGFAYGRQHLSVWRDFLFVITPIMGVNFVILFFVQSGYLMGKVFHEGRYKLTREGIWSFYKNRFLRIAPLLYFSLLICIMYAPEVIFDPIKILGDFLFITNLTGRSINPVTWSLSHEMQYYLIAPFVFWIFSRMPDRKAFAYSVGIGLLFLLFFAKPTNRGFHFEYAFLLGYAVNIALRRWKLEIGESTKLAALLVGAFMVHVVFNFCVLWNANKLGALFASAPAAIAIYFLECPSDFSLSRRYRWYARVIGYFVFTGEIAFSLYLWHYPFIFARDSFFGQLTDAVLPAGANPFIGVLLFHAIQLSIVLPILYATSTATFYLIERRFRPRLYGADDIQHQALAAQEPTTKFCI